MAYGKMKDEKKKYEQNGIPNIQINPIDDKVRQYNNPIHIAQQQPTSSSSSASVTSSSPFQPVKKPLLHQTIKPEFESIRRSASNISLSSRYSYDNIDENTEDIRPPLPYYTNNKNSKQMKRIYINQNSTQSDTLSTNSALTLRTDSYRQAHPLQSFAFDYPKRSLLPQSIENNNRRKLNGNKHYEIAV